MAATFSGSTVTALAVMLAGPASAQTPSVDPGAPDTIEEEVSFEEEVTFEEEVDGELLGVLAPLPEYDRRGWLWMLAALFAVALAWNVTWRPAKATAYGSPKRRKPKGRRPTGRGKRL